MKQDEIRALLDYDPETGIVTRKTAHPRFPAGSMVGHLRTDGYLDTSVGGKQRLLHRLIWLWMTGDFPTSPIDHMNGVRDDNRWCNLRVVSASENQHNLGGARGHNKSSGLLGVHYDKQLKKFRADIKVDGKQRFLGSHSDPNEAQKIYLAAKDKLHPTHNFHNRSNTNAH